MINRVQTVNAIRFALFLYFTDVSKKDLKGKVWRSFCYTLRFASSLI